MQRIIIESERERERERERDDVLYIIGCTGVGGGEGKRNVKLK